MKKQFQILPWQIFSLLCFPKYSRIFHNSIVAICSIIQQSPWTWAAAPTPMHRHRGCSATPGSKPVGLASIPRRQGPASRARPRRRAPCPRRSRPDSWSSLLEEFAFSEYCKSSLKCFCQPVCNTECLKFLFSKWNSSSEWYCELVWLLCYVSCSLRYIWCWLLTDN